MIQYYPIPTICSVRTDGTMIPLYVQLEEKYKLVQRKIISYEETTQKEQRAIGYYYKCILDNDLRINMQYSFAQHKWLSDTIII